MPLGYLNYGASPTATRTFSPTVSGSTTRSSSGGKTLAQRIAEIVGYKVTSRGTTYEVAKRGTNVFIRVTPPGGTAALQVTPTSSNWAQVATAVLNLKSRAAAAAPKTSSATGPGGSRSARTGTTTTTTTTTTTPDAGAGGGSTTQAPSWATAIYLAEMTALVGATIPSNIYPGVSFTIKTVALDGVDAPVISVTPAGGSATDVAPNMSQWTDTASQVIAAKYAMDAGTPAPTGGSGTTVVTSETTSPGYDIVTSETVPSSDEALAEQAVATVDAAVAGGATTVSTTTAAATGDEGFFAKYKWWIAGGVVLAGGYAYMHKQNATKYPLPDFLSKMVK